MDVLAGDYRSVLNSHSWLHFVTRYFSPHQNRSGKLGMNYISLLARYHNIDDSPLPRRVLLTCILC